MNEVDDLQKDVKGWADSLSPSRRPQDAVVKLVSEAAELLDAVLNKDVAAVADELADVQILLADLAEMHGLNLIQVARVKMLTNRRRKWEVVDGVIRRVK